MHYVKVINGIFSMYYFLYGMNLHNILTLCEIEFEQ